LNGVDQRRAPRRQQTGDERDGGENYGDHKHCRQIGCADSEKQTLEQTGASKHADQTEK
jgi:hypothetical protein